MSRRPVSLADERHDAALERRALREARAADRARSAELAEEFAAGRAHERRVQARRRARRRTPLGRVGRQVTRGATTPISGPIYSAAGLLGTMLALVALYLVLTSAETVADVVRLVRRGLRWLASPRTSIPYGKEA